MKNVVVVGGSGCIGKAICKCLSDKYSVYNADLNQSHQYGTFIYTNILNAYSLDQTLYTIKERGGLYGIINATYPKPTYYMKNTWYNTSDKDYLTFFNQHLISNINLCKRAYEYGINNTILLSSIYGNIIPDDKMYEGSCIKKPPLEYCVSKAGLNHLVRYLSKYMHINAIAPGGIESKEMDTVFKQHYGAFTNVNDVAGMVKYLLSEEGHGINGQIITVDGGFSI